MFRVRRCTRCSRPVKGHPGPTGSKCHAQPQPRVSQPQSGADDEGWIDVEESLSNEVTSLHSEVNEIKNMIRNLTLSSANAGASRAPSVAASCSVQTFTTVSVVQARSSQSVLSMPSNNSQALEQRPVTLPVSTVHSFHIPESAPSSHEAQVPVTGAQPTSPITLGVPITFQLPSSVHELARTTASQLPSIPRSVSQGSLAMAPRPFVDSPAGATVMTTSTINSAIASVPQVPFVNPPSMSSPFENTSPTIQSEKVDGVSEKVATAALSGEFVNMEDLLTQYSSCSNDFKTFTDSSGVVHMKPSRAKRSVSNVFRWLEAWSRYEKVLVKGYGLRILDVLVDYRMHIVGLAQQYNWSAVLMYDVRHRSKIACQKSLEFTRIDQNLYLSVFTNAVVKNYQSCTKCNAFDHMHFECPFLVNESQRKPGSKSRKEIQSEVCRLFNENRCKYGNKCHRKHVCSGCEGTDSFRNCKKCNKSNNSS